MLDWENVRHFLAVADSGSLSGAARTLKVDHATVSRRLAALETELGVRLIDRLPRSCRLTAVGHQAALRAREMEAGADGIVRLAKAAEAPLVSRVNLSAPPVLVTHILAERLVQFRATNANVRLSVSAEGQQVSLARREADVAVRLVRPKEADIYARRVGTMRFALYAHKAYSDQTNPRDWQFIAFGEGFSDMPQQRWLLGIAGDRPIACELNHISEHLIAARAGAGVAGLPRFIGDADADLVRIRPDMPEFAREIWLLVHRDLRHAPAVRAVMDFVAEAIAAHRELLSA